MLAKKILCFFSISLLRPYLYFKFVLSNTTLHYYPSIISFTVFFGIALFFFLAYGVQWFLCDVLVVVKFVPQSKILHILPMFIPLYRFPSTIQNISLSSHLNLNTTTALLAADVLSNVYILTVFTSC
jgi:hypothetical protein